MVSQIVKGVSAADENENNKVVPQVISNGFALDRPALKEQKIFSGVQNNHFHRE